MWRFGRRLPPAEPRCRGASLPSWKQADPGAIARSLERALSRPHGDWYVLDATRRLGKKPRRFEVGGVALVAWRVHGETLVGPEACPHMGASLTGASLNGEGKVVCPWHGLALGRHGHGEWQCLKAHDDGVLTWVRLGEGDQEVPRPILAPRPAKYLDGVISVEARCDPQDVIANRLDPWHGVHYHPYSFRKLQVLSCDEDVLRLRVAKRVVGKLCVEVDATFHSPEPRTIVMTIVDGEGTGSVVETHATPMGPGRTMVVEATLATSDRKGFGYARKVGRLIRPFIERSARRLWVDDAAYAERLYELRVGGTN